MSSFGKRSGIAGYSNELMKALSPQCAEAPAQHAAGTHADLSAVKAMLAAATAGDARAKMTATMAGVRFRRPGL